MIYEVLLKLFMGVEEKATVVLIEKSIGRLILIFCQFFFHSPVNISFFSRGISLAMKAAG